MTIDRQDTDSGTFYGYKFGSMSEVRYSSAEAPLVAGAPTTNDPDTAPHRKTRCQTALRLPHPRNHPPPRTSFISATLNPGPWNGCGRTGSHAAP
jgi:hypothetical protein